MRRELIPCKIVNRLLISWSEECAWMIIVILTLYRLLLVKYAIVICDDILTSCK